MNDKRLLMSTRLKMPQPRKDYVIREELFSKLDRMSEYRVILLKGGAGTGKTTLIASFAKERAISDIKWISLDESCNNVFLFWGYFIEAVGVYLGAEKQDFMSLYEANFQKSNMEQLLTLLVNSLDNQKDMFIVLDDFYHITDEFLIHTLEFFLRNVSDNVHLLLLTRQEPLLYIGALNMEGKLLVIDENDLKLSNEAGMKFLTETLKMNLNPETMEIINSLSEGWIGGLQLVAAAAASKTGPEIKNLNLGNRLADDYLTKEIFEGLSREEKEFLVFTSIMTYFNEEICLRLLEKNDFKEIMEGLLRKNVLIMCIDEEKGFYRYHNILREYLKGRLKGYSKEERIRLHLKAAEILREMGDCNQCIDQLLMAEDYLNAMQYIAEVPQNMSLFSFADRIPERFILQDMDFTFQYYFYNYANMEFKKCRKLYDAFKVNMGGEAAFSSFRFINMLVEDNIKLDEIDVSPIEEIEKLPLKESTKALILIRDASFLHAQYRYEEALAFIDKAIKYSAGSSNFFIDFFSFSIKSQILEYLGELKKCETMYKDIHKIMLSNKYITMFNTSFYIGSTGLHLKQMNLKSAENCLKNAAEYITDMTSPTVIGYKYNLAEYKFIIGETEGALELVKELMKTEIFKNLVFMSPLLQYVFRIDKFSGELVKHFTDSYESAEERYKSLEGKLLYSNILFHRGKASEAVDLIDQILKYSRMQKIKLKLVQAALLKINMIFENPGKKREILNLFREALFYSCEDKILLPFFEEREIVTKVISLYEHDFNNDLNFAEKAHYKEILGLYGIGTKSILSEREIDVLKEMTRGASNKEIAECLCISLATVKSHIINIYGKLQVNNRVSAIEAVKNLRIL